MNEQNPLLHDTRKPLIPTRRGRVVAALVLTALMTPVGTAVYRSAMRTRAQNQLEQDLKKPDVMQSYNAGKIDHHKVVVVHSDENTTASEFTVHLPLNVRDERQVSDLIDAQAGPDGVHAGDSYVVPANDLRDSPQQAAQN